MMPTIKKAIFTFLMSICLIFLFNQVVTTFLSTTLLTVGVPFLIYMYSNIIFGDNNEKILIYNLIINNNFTIIKTVILYLSLIILSETYKDPELEILIKMQEYLTIIFLLVLCAQSLYSINIKNINFFISTICNNIYFYFLIIWFLGTYAETLYSWSLNNKNESIAVFVSVIISLLAFGNIFKRESIFRGKESEPLSYAEKPKKLSEKDKKYTAVHEIGHALFYSYLKEIPDDFKIVVNNSSKGVLGYVTFFEGDTIVEEKKYAEWLMLVYLAGNNAEKFIYGDSTLGGMSDYSSWCRMAKKYLKNGNKGVFYSNPENEYEHNENQKKIELLKLEQEKIIENFFKENKELIIEFSNTLMKKGSMTKKDCAFFFENVNRIKEIPFLK
jgi:hypothetical protein